MTADEVRATAEDGFQQIEDKLGEIQVLTEQLRALPMHEAILHAVIRLDADLRGALRIAKNVQPFLREPVA